jgi:hypothetical protein
MRAWLHADAHARVAQVFFTRIYGPVERCFAAAAEAGILRAGVTAETATWALLSLMNGVAMAAEETGLPAAHLAAIDVLLHGVMR